MSELQKTLASTLREAVLRAAPQDEVFHRHSRALSSGLTRGSPGHPRLSCGTPAKAWMPATGAGMTSVDGNPPGKGEGEEKRPRDKTRADSLRQLSDTLALSRLCDRAACKRAKTCVGEAERCLTLYAECVPLAAREFIVGLLNSREFGYTFEEALKQHQEGARAYLDWSSSVIPGRELCSRTRNSGAAGDVLRLSHRKQEKRHALRRRDTRSGAAGA